MPSANDAADDAAIWIHRTNPALSTIIGTDKLSGLGVYALDGTQLQFLTTGQPNNVDLRYHFVLGGRSTPIVVVSDRLNDRIELYRVDDATGLLEPTVAGTIPLDSEPYGICLYVSPVDGAHYVFVNDKGGVIEQWRISDDGAGELASQMVRTFSVGSQPEGCVADDELGLLYLGEELVGIWRYGAEPGDSTAGVLVDTTSGFLTVDVEGLTIYYEGDGSGYLLASSQGSSEFVVYERTPPNSYVATFAVVDGAIDGTSITDGIDVTNVSLGPSFPAGLFVAQDNANPGGNQNFKLVRWDDIAAIGDPVLDVDTSFDPRSIGNDLFADGFEGGDATGWSASVGG